MREKENQESPSMAANVCGDDEVAGSPWFTEPPSSAPDMSEAEEDHSGRYSDGDDRRPAAGGRAAMAEELAASIGGAGRGPQ